MPAELLAALKSGWPGLLAIGAWGTFRSLQALAKIWKEREERHEAEIKRLNEARIEEANRYASGLLAAADRGFKLAESEPRPRGANDV